MKVIGSGDHHWDEHSRFVECLRVHTWMAEKVERERADLFVSGGDIYERASTPLERKAVSEWLSAIAETCPVVIARGNHDRQFDCELLGRLRTKHPIIVEERCGVHVVAGIAVGVMAWPNRGSLAAMSGRPLPSETLDDIARECMRDVLRGIRVSFEQCAEPRLLLTHAMINGAKTSLGQPLIGAEMNVGLDDLALAGAPIVVASHIHCPQEFRHGDTEVVYCGSPFRTAFGETEEKSIVSIEFDGGTCSWRRLPTPATGMALIEGEWNAVTTAIDITSKTFPHPKTIANAEVRFRYIVAADQRDVAKRAASALHDRMIADGAIRVKVEEEVFATMRARAPEVAAARTLTDKLQALWRMRDVVPETARATRLITKVAGLEEAYGT